MAKLSVRNVLHNSAKEDFSVLSICFLVFPENFSVFWKNRPTPEKKNTERTIADPPRYLLNLNLNYEKLRHKNRQKTLFRNIRDPYFCIFQHKNLLSVIIEGNPGLEVGGVSDNLNNLPVAETVMLDPLSCTELQNRGRDEL